jgi:uncharacterized RDD family membrane protein YckC
MEFDLIETPENVELEQRLAGIGTRLMAGLVDTSILFAAFFIAFLILILIEIAGTLSTMREAIRSPWLLALIMLVLFVLIWGYFALFELHANGQTPGKKYMRIRVVKEGGGAIGFAEVAIRNLLRPVDGAPLYVIAGMSMFFTRKSQRLGDLAAGTVVISEATQDYSASADRPRKTDWAAPTSADDLRKTLLTPEEFRLLSSFQRRRDELTLEARERLLARLLPPILGRLGRSAADESLSALEWLVDELLSGNDGMFTDREEQS